MHQSGLFDRWRLPQASVVWYPEPTPGGEFFYCSRSPSTGSVEKRVVAPTANCCVAFDADTIFHGVSPVVGSTDDGLTKNAYLVPGHDEQWYLHRNDGAVARVASYRAAELRFSMSWKAYCFPDTAFEQGRDHSDDLALGDILPALVALLTERGALRMQELAEKELVDVLIDEFIPFPPPDGAE